MTNITTNQNSKYIVLGASRGSGLAVLKELLKQGYNAIGVSSSGIVPKGISQNNFAKADATNLSELLKVCSGATHIYNNLNVEYSKWTEILPIFANNVIEVATQIGAKVIYLDNLYCYGPVEGSMAESMPNKATDTKGKLRGQITQMYLTAHNSGKIKVVIPRASDFFGADVLSSVSDRFFPNILQNKPIQNIGDPTKSHSFTYVKDLARATILLANDESTYGQVWHIPANQSSVKKLAELTSTIAGKPYKISNLGKIMVTVVGLFVPVIKEIKPLYYQYSRDYIINSTKFEKQFPQFQKTPLNQALTETLDFYK